MGSWQAMDFWILADIFKNAYGGNGTRKFPVHDKQRPEYLFMILIKLYSLQSRYFSSTV